MVLAGDEGPAVRKARHGLVPAPVAELELHGLPAHGERRQLMPQADAEDRHAADQLADLRDLIHVLGGIAGPVGEHDAVGRQGKHLLGGDAVGQHGDAAFPARERPDNAALYAVIDQRHMKPLRPLGGDLEGGFRAHRSHGVPKGPRADLRQVVGDLLADGGVHHALGAQDPCQRAGVHPADTDNALLGQKPIQGILASEVAWLGAKLAHHIAAGGAAALEVGGDHAVVADEREGLCDDLTGVAGVGQGLEIPHHPGSEHQLSHGLPGRADPLAGEDHSVGQYQICFFHNRFSGNERGYRVSAMTAFMVCMRFSASSNTMDRALSNTSSVTSIQSMPNFSYTARPFSVPRSW